MVTVDLQEEGEDLVPHQQVMVSRMECVEDEAHPEWLHQDLPEEDEGLLHQVWAADLLRGVAECHQVVGDTLLRIEEVTVEEVQLLATTTAVPALTMHRSNRIHKTRRIV